MLKRVFNLLLAMAVATMMFAVGAVAVSAAEEVTITVGEVTGKKGDMVEVPITISENSYMTAADMHLLFDTTKLKLVTTYYDDSSCIDISDTMFDDTWLADGNEKNAGDLYVVLASSNPIGLTAGGEMFRVAFEILADDATTADLTLEVDPICGNSDGETEYDIQCTVVNGSVTIEKATLLGDVNGDGKVNVNDAIVMYRVFAGMGGSLSDEQLAVADYNGDGNVNINDAIAIYKTVAGV